MVACVGEVVGKRAFAMTAPPVGELVEAVVGPPEESLVHQAVEIAGLEPGVVLQEPFEELQVRLVAKALVLQPEHHLGDLVSPEETFLGAPFRFVGRLHVVILRSSPSGEAAASRDAVTGRLAPATSARPCGHTASLS